MKKYLLFMFAFFVLYQLNAQTWTVGIPVNRTIIDYSDNIFTTHFCDSLNYPNGQECEFRLDLPQVSGINYYVVIDFATNPSHTYKLRYGSNTQIMSLGDSMLLLSTGLLDTIHLSYAGYESYVSVKFKAVGIPTIAGQSYPCGSTNNGWFYQGIGCYYPIMADNSTYLTNCQIQSSAGITDHSDLSETILSPNPTPGKIYLQVPEQFGELKKMEIFDYLGQLKLVTTGNFIETDLSSFSSGLYIVVLTTTDEVRQTIKFIKE
jgi:hypothetical protein